MKIIKKICFVLFGVLYFFSYNFNVFAQDISIHDVASEFVNGYYIKSFNELGAELSMQVDESNSLLNIMSESEIGMTFNYTDEYILFDNSDSEPTEENVDENFGYAISILGIISSLFNLCGYTDYMIEDFDDSITYEEYGIDLETEYYEFNGEYEDGGTWSKNGDYLRYFKISLDSEKISKLAEDYGVPIEMDDEINPDFINLVPNIKASDITSNSVYIYVGVDGYDYNSEEIPYCYIYRSTSEDGEFEKISDLRFACTGMSVGDQNLESDTTYYYKARVVGSEKFSEVISVTTLKEATVSDGIGENPNTGTSYLFVFFMIGLISLSYIFRGFKGYFNV